MADFLTFDGVTAGYDESVVLEGVSFSLGEGESLALLGRNGVGKTTLLKCLMGLVPAKAGTIRFDNQDITKSPSHERVKAGIGYVPQGREIFPRLTVHENLQMGLATRPAGTDIPPRIFKMFPVLEQMLKRRGGDLAIGRALAFGPKLLILDEPTEGIQPSIIKDIERAIRALAEEGSMAILLVEQYYDFARSLADQYLVMERGEIIKRGAGADMEKDGVRELLAV